MLEYLSEQERTALQPRGDLSIDEWIEDSIELPSKSPIPGPYRFAVNPSYRYIAKSCQSWDVDEIYLCAPAQKGKTILFASVMAYFVDQEPCDIFYVCADEITSKHILEEKILPIFRDSYALRHLYSKDRFTKKEAKFDNGSTIEIQWASSVAGLASRTKRIVIGDEIDKPGWSMVTQEASSISLLGERVAAYPIGYRKSIFFSTPTTDAGNITQAQHLVDAVFDWHVPCPFCGVFQPLRFSNEYAYGFTEGQYRDKDGGKRPLGRVYWEGGSKASKKEIEEARYECGSCKGLWTDAQRMAANEKGVMVSRNEIEGKPLKIYFHDSRLYSHLDVGRMSVLVDKFTSIMRMADGEKKTLALQGFVNSALAEPFRKLVIKLSDSKILKAVCDLDPLTVPETAVALTAGVDVQGYGFWYIVRAWAADYTSWLIDYGLLHKWADVENLLFSTYYPIEGSNRKVPVYRAGVDTGGGLDATGRSLTEDAYHWIRANGVGRGCRVWGTKGSSKPLQGKMLWGKPFDKAPSGRPIPGGLQIIHLDTDKMKDLFHWRLNQAQNNGHQAAYLNKKLKKNGEDYIAQILAEEKRRDPKIGDYWHKLRRDNHYLDCECICHAMADYECIGGGIHLLAPEENEVQSVTKTEEGKNKWLPKSKWRIG